MFRIKIANWGKKHMMYISYFQTHQIEIAMVKQKLIFQISLGRDDPGDPSHFISRC